MPSPAAAVPDSRLRLVIIVCDSSESLWPSSMLFGENLLPICSQ